MPITHNQHHLGVCWHARRWLAKVSRDRYRVKLPQQQHEKQRRWRHQQRWRWRRWWRRCVLSRHAHSSVAHVQQRHWRSCGQHPVGRVHPWQLHATAITTATSECGRRAPLCGEASCHRSRCCSRRQRLWHCSCRWPRRRRGAGARVPTRFCRPRQKLC